MDIRAGIGQKLKHLRLNAGLSQEKLAEFLDVHIQAIGKVETGKIFISEKVLTRACAFFKVKPRYFFEFEETKPSNHSKPVFVKQIYKIVQALYED